MYHEIYLNWVTVTDLNSKNFDNAQMSGKYLDFIISNQPLNKYLGFESKNIVTPFGWFLNKNEQIRILKEFRLQTKTKLPNNRIELYICPACGDIGCGSVTAQIFDKGDKILWTNFANQSDEQEVGELFDVKTLEFERNNYYKAFSQVK